MVVICGPYMPYAHLTLSMMIGKFLLWFLSISSLSASVDGYTMNFCIILDVSVPSIKYLWGYDLLLFTVLKKTVT